ncbi:MAG: hypothetical protein KBA06_05245 [Saprospiraceae bacterium]|nr:hypothetical protein [Saprospiraceae bacterium]
MRKWGIGLLLLLPFFYTWLEGLDASGQIERTTLVAIMTSYIFGVYAFLKPPKHTEQEELEMARIRAKFAEVNSQRLIFENQKIEDIEDIEIMKKEYKEIVDEMELLHNKLVKIRDKK